MARPDSSPTAVGREALLALLFSSIASTTSVPEMDTIRLGLEWFLNPDHTPLLLAKEHGWLEDAGLNLEVIEPEEHLDAVTAIEEGDMDVAVTEPLHLVEDRAAGRPVVGFTRFLHTNGGVMYRPDAGIERPRDLAGTRLQYPGAPGPGGPAIAGSMVEADGGTYDPDAFTPVDYGFYHTDALVDGEADAATLAFYNFELVEAAHRGLEAEFFALKDWGIPDFCQLVLISTPSRLEERRDAFARLVEVLRRGIDLLHQRPAEARAVYARRTGADLDDEQTDAIFGATLPCFTYDLSMTAQYYEQLEAWMAGRNLIDDRPGKGAYWTNALALPGPGTPSQETATALR